MFNRISEHGYLLTSSDTFSEMHSFFGLIYKCIMYYKYLIYDVGYTNSCFYILFTILFYMLFHCFIGSGQRCAGVQKTSFSSLTSIFRILYLISSQMNIP